MRVRGAPQPHSLLVAWNSVTIFCCSIGGVVCAVTMASREAAFRWESVSDLSDRLAAAFCHFNDGGCDEGIGRLVQAWEPKIAPNGSIYLATKELPVSVCGTGDVLALFRYICCGHRFYPDPSQRDTLGVVGRVFLTGEAEVCGDVQSCGSTTYLRASEAARCGVHSTLCLPLFADASRSAVVAVLEIVDLNKDDSFGDMLGRLVACLQMVLLYTVDIDMLSNIQSKFMRISLNDEDEEDSELLI
ncbi:hypothetical protein BSKO_09987 [Bryopsis sp. KO-2023]|nr:hypothetical protein BSKO_09987 [Bryopsis sp. KO-2023]